MNLDLLHSLLAQSLRVVARSYPGKDIWRINMVQLHGSIQQVLSMLVPDTN